MTLAPAAAPAPVAQADVPSPSGPPGGASPRRRGLAVRILVGAVRAYQLARGGRPSPCRYWPTCSVYAAEAVKTHGALRGTALGTRRLARCHPFGGHGVDPVPPAVRRAESAG